MPSKEAAQIFHDWAVIEGLMPNGPVSAITSGPAEFAQITPRTEVGKQILRSKQIQSIAFNEARNEIVIFTKRVAPVSKKLLATVSMSVGDISVKYRQGLQDAIGDEPPVPFGGPPFVVRHVGAVDRYTCGSSISVGNFRDAGTMGCLVRDAGGILYGLSNNHISASCNFAGIGLPILAPGVVDVAPNALAPFTIGFHTATLPMVVGLPDNVDAKANRDAAIFRIADPNAVSSHQGTAYDSPVATAPFAPDLEVEKVGRTTGHTHGKVIGQIHGAVPISYNCALYNFTGRVCFEPAFTIVGVGNLFSDNGDSGSLITTVNAAGERKAVGIVVGGMNDGSAPGKKITVALPIHPVLAEFGVSLVGGHNV